VTELLRFCVFFCVFSHQSQITIFVMGCVVQLSGHLSIFLIGSSAIDLSDQTHLSRDKLAFLIDSTAAPVASLSLVSSFMAVQVRKWGKSLIVLLVITPCF
jgi:hypothetical protein